MHRVADLYIHIGTSLVTCQFWLRLAVGQCEEGKRGQLEARYWVCVSDFESNDRAVRYQGGNVETDAEGGAMMASAWRTDATRRQCAAIH